MTGSPVAGLVLLVSVCWAVSVAPAKECSRLVTARMRANARENAKKYAWAGSEQKSAVAGARVWAERSDDELWAMITSQELPRGIHTNKEVGCPNCGKGIVPYGNYPWKCNFRSLPWKIRCPNCGGTFPKNDFQAFYNSALDEHGMFRRERGDRSLLFNAEHPNPNDPLHKTFVDDGYGMVGTKGKKHFAIAYCNWILHRSINNGIRRLARAYALTGDELYAHKAAVLLDRLADVYPEMDFWPFHELGFEHSHGGSGKGRIEGRIWETNIGNLGYAYDVIYDGIQRDAKLVQFCSRMSARHKLGDKNNVRTICRHIEDHLLQEILKGIEDSRIRGNSGMHQKCLALVAIALDRPKLTEKWLDRLFDPGFLGRRDSIPWVLVEGLDRDGMGGECGRYGVGWTVKYAEMPELLAMYPDYARHDLVSEYPKLKQCFLIGPRLLCLDTVFPPIGDSGSTGDWSGRRGWGAEVTSPAHFVRGFNLYGDPRMAAFAWHYAGDDKERLRLPTAVFAKDPMALAQRIAAVGQTMPFRLKSDHLGRYGQAVLQTENQANGRALWIHYGFAKGHSHTDTLNLGLYAHNIDMLPDLGYPEYASAWPKRCAWTNHTVSHVTLQINDALSRRGAGGKINLFAVQPPVRVVGVSSLTAYRGVKTYCRTAALIDISTDDSYVFDVFRARGGKNHRLSFHGPSSVAAVGGIKLTSQGEGTFAGKNIKFAQPYDGEQGYGYRGSGFMYLYDVERSVEPVRSDFTVDWKVEDRRGRIAKGHEPHLRLHALTPCDEVALASGDPPQNKKGNPRRLRYLILSRLGDNVESQFVTVLEPYDKTPFIRRVRRLKVQHTADENSVVAVAVDLVNGATDVLISCEEPTRVRVEGDIEFDGQFGMIRFVRDKVECMRMSNARLLKAKSRRIASKVAACRGRVTRVDASNPADNRVFLSPPLPTGARFVGETIHFRNDVPLDTSYEIKAVGAGYISTGDITIVRGFGDQKDFRAGYKYLVNAGDEYVVPVHTAGDRAVGFPGDSGKGSTGAGVRTAGSRAVGLPKPRRAERKKADDETVARYDAELIKRVIEEVQAGREPKFFLRMGRGPVRTVSAGERGKLKVEVLRTGTELDVEWQRLTVRDKRSLALAVLREGNPSDHCLAAFYMIAAGDELGAKEHLEKGGDGAAKVRSEFSD